MLESGLLVTIAGVDETQMVVGLGLAPRVLDRSVQREGFEVLFDGGTGPPQDLGAIRINPLSPDPAVTEVIRRAFLNDLPAGSSDYWRQFLHPDLPLSSFITPVPVSPERWGRLPRTYIRWTEDLALPPVTQDLIAEADQVAPDQPFEVRSLPCGHSPFVTRPVELATTLASIALQRLTWCPPGRGIEPVVAGPAAALRTVAYSAFKLNGSAAADCRTIRGRWC
jgi:hypothetical protein